MGAWAQSLPSRLDKALLKGRLNTLIRERQLAIGVYLRYDARLLEERSFGA